MLLFAGKQKQERKQDLYKIPAHCHFNIVVGGGQLESEKMYLSNQLCSDCGHRLYVTWSWPPVITGKPFPLIFVCQNCALQQCLDGYAVKKPFPNDMIITPKGSNVLLRHYDAYNQALPFMQNGRFITND